jgi:hypothetical protein
LSLPAIAGRGERGEMRWNLAVTGVNSALCLILSNYSLHGSQAMDENALRRHVFCV